MSGSKEGGDLSEEDGSRFWRTDGSMDGGGVSGAGAAPGWLMSSITGMVSSSSSSVESSSRYFGLIGDHLLEILGLSSSSCLRWVLV